MKGLWLENKQVSLRTDIPEPTPKYGEAKIKVNVAGICNTDIELQKGYYPYTGVLGHEFVGTVTECEERPELVGKRVVGEINAACGDCTYCTRYDMPTHCSRRTVLGIQNRDGALGEYTVLPAKNLLVVPDSVSDEVAAFTEPLAAALEIQDQLKILPFHKVLSLGDGKLGQLVAQTLALTGCQLTVFGRHDSKLANLRKRGIECVILKDKNVLPPEYGGAFDFVVECTGNQGGFELARRALRPRGTLVLKSTYAGNLTVDMSAIVVDEITLVGSRCGPFDKALKVLEEGKVDVSGLIQATYGVDEAMQAFEAAQQPGAQKVLVRF